MTIGNAKRLSAGKKRGRGALAAVLTMVALLVLALQGRDAPVVYGAALCVDPHGSHGCYTHIQDAVSAASAGDTISVAPGKYQEEVTISKSLTLTGTEGHSSVIDATGLDHAILIKGTQNVQVSKLGATNANLQGILVQDSSSVTLDRDVVTNNDKSLNITDPSHPSCPGSLPFDGEDCGEGINLIGVTNSTVTNSDVEGNAGGILLTDETGPTHDNLIKGNTVKNNRFDCGITIPTHTTTNGVYANTVEDNTVTGNGTSLPGGAGIGLFAPVPNAAQVTHNTIRGNTITGNGIGGVVMHSHAPGQDLNDNQILDNVISGNGALGDADSGVSDAGIIVFAAVVPITGTVVTGNWINQEAIDVWVGSNASPLALHNNSLLGNQKTVGVENAGTGAVDATNNWWGCSKGPGNPGCTTVKGLSVTFIPVLSTPAPHP